MSDLAAVVLAVAVWAGALAALPVPRWPGIVLVVAALVLRRSGLLVVGAFVVASALGAATWRGLTPPVTAVVQADAVLVGDPVPVGHAVRIDVRIGGRRVEAWARGAPAAALRPRLAGEVVALVGRLRPPPPEARPRLATRHVAARLDVADVGGVRFGSPVSTAANRLRRLLVRGAEPLSPGHRALFSGLLIGDDRDLPPVMESDFRAAGLTHLLAVSGSNVAVLLAAAGPALRRVQLRGRLALSLALIGFFAVVTRAEPSVLRASAMAAIACWAAFAGRPVSRLRVLCLAVAGLLVIDPMLTRSVGFQLSVGASLGLVLLARPIAQRLRGPRWLAESLAVTMAAQVGVAPVLTTTFGGLPLVTVVANLFAVPAAGPLTAWGLTAGLIAGVLGPPFDAVIHLPSRVLVGWIEAVARLAAGIPVGIVSTTELAAAALAFGAVHRLGWRRAAAAVAVIVLVVGARPPGSGLDGRPVARHVQVWRAGGVVVALGGTADSARVLDGLRRAGIRRIDLMVVRTGGRAMASLVGDVRARVPVRAVAAPVRHRIRDATAVTEPMSLAVGNLLVELTPVEGYLVVEVGRP